MLCSESRFEHQDLHFNIIYQEGKIYWEQSILVGIWGKNILEYYFGRIYGIILYGNWWQMDGETLLERWDIKPLNCWSTLDNLEKENILKQNLMESWTVLKPACCTKPAAYLCKMVRTPPKPNRHTEQKSKYSTFLAQSFFFLWHISSYLFYRYIWQWQNATQQYYPELIFLLKTHTNISTTLVN